MNKEQITQYLANIYFVARSDGSVDAIEQKLIEKVATEIGGGFFDVKTARDTAEAADFKMVWPARLSDRVRLVEDMMLIACADSQLYKMEKKVLNYLVTELSLNDKHIERMRKLNTQRMADMNSTPF